MTQQIYVIILRIFKNKTQEIFLLGLTSQTKINIAIFLLYLKILELCLIEPKTNFDY